MNESNSPFHSFGQQSEVIITQDQKAFLSKYMTTVYGWMSLALFITAGLSYFVSSTPALVQLFLTNGFIVWGLIILEFVLIGIFTVRLSKMNTATARFIFLLYAALNGISLSGIFLLYTHATIFSVFFITAGTFAIMSIVGYTTKTDLSSFGRILMMALVGVILATLVNVFLKSPGFQYIISYIGIAIFVGLIAYDTQKIKEMALVGTEDGHKKGAVFGALMLYLDFLNLFLYLLQAFSGRSKNSN